MVAPCVSTSPSPSLGKSAVDSAAAVVVLAVAVVVSVAVTVVPVASLAGNRIPDSNSKKVWRSCRAFLFLL